MTLPELLERIAHNGCPEFGFHYDIRQMQNVTADDCQFPAIFMEEYYGSRTIKGNFGSKRELTVELHFQQLVQMQGVAMSREQVRDWLRENGVRPFIAAWNEYAAANGLEQVEEYQDDPEPPMFDANATGVLLRVALLTPSCWVIVPPEAKNPVENK